MAEDEFSGIGGVTRYVVVESIGGLYDFAATSNGDASSGADSCVSAEGYAYVWVVAISYSIWADDFMVHGSAFIDDIGWASDPCEKLMIFEETAID